MTKHNYITMRTFEEKYNLCRGHVWVMIGSGSIPRSVIKEMDKGTTLVDENFFIRRVDFRTKIWNENHLMYYFMTKAMTQSDLAKILAKTTGKTMQSWNTWCSVQLFQLQEISICDYKVRKTQWEFNRVVKAIINKAFRLKHIPKTNRDLEVLILKD